MQPFSFRFAVAVVLIQLVKGPRGHECRIFLLLFLTSHPIPEEKGLPPPSPSYRTVRWPETVEKIRHFGAPKSQENGNGEKRRLGNGNKKVFSLFRSIGAVTKRETGSQ